MQDIWLYLYYSSSFSIDLQCFKINMWDGEHTPNKLPTAVPRFGPMLLKGSVKLGHSDAWPLPKPVPQRCRLATAAWELSRADCTLSVLVLWGEGRHQGDQMF